MKPDSDQRVTNKISYSCFKLLIKPIKRDRRLRKKSSGEGIKNRLRFCTACRDRIGFASHRCHMPRGVGFLPYLGLPLISYGLLLLPNFNLVSAIRCASENL